MSTATTETDARAALIQNDFTADEFQRRRAAVFAAIGTDAVALLAGAVPLGAFGTFRQFNDFYYLCGVEVPGAYLLLDGRTEKSTLYLPPHNARGERVDGPTLCTNDADLLIGALGLDRVAEPSALADDLAGAAAVHTPLEPAETWMGSRDGLTASRRWAEADAWNGRPSAEAHFKAVLADRLPNARVEDLSPVIDGLRRVKSAQEIALMRQAGALCAAGLNAAMRRTAAGVMEYQLAAEAQFVYQDGGARGPGYSPIAAGGANIWHAHYWRMNQPVRDGDLFLFDCAPDLRYYTSDIGRMWPVNGTYDPTQRRLYSFVVEYHKVLLDLIKPGLTTDQIHDAAAEKMRPIVDAMEFADAEEEKGVRATLAFHKHLTHGVGMSVHDHGYWGEAPLEPGAVIALDPQLWIPEKQVYVRVEDTIVVTEDGLENFTSDAPLELDDVEAMVGAGS